MSDDEYEYDYGSDADYDYGSDQGEEQQDDGNDELIEIENSYYGMFDEMSAMNFFHLKLYVG
jgi:hypothetical protein